MQTPSARRPRSRDGDMGAEAGTARDAVVPLHDGAPTQLAILNTGKSVGIAPERPDGAARVILDEHGRAVAVALSSGELVELPVGPPALNGCATLWLDSTSTPMARQGIVSVTSHMDCSSSCAQSHLSYAGMRS